MKQAEWQQEFMAQEKAKKLKSYRQLNKIAKKGQILFVGSSLMEWFPICEIAQSCGMDALIYNRGIAGFTTDELLENMEVLLFELAPSRLFINIGTNDIRMRPDGSDWKEHLLRNYRQILRVFQEHCPMCGIHVLSYYPVNPAKANNFRMRQALQVRTNEALREVNCDLKLLAAEFGCRYLDVSSGLMDESGALKAEYTVDGMHLYPEAYFKVIEVLRPYLI